MKKISHTHPRSHLCTFSRVACRREVKGHRETRRGRRGQKWIFVDRERLHVLEGDNHHTTYHDTPALGGLFTIIHHMWFLFLYTVIHTVCWKSVFLRRQRARRGLPARMNEPSPECCSSPEHPTLLWTGWHWETHTHTQTQKLHIYIYIQGISHTLLSKVTFNKHICHKKETTTY